MAWDLTGVRRGTSEEQGCYGLKVQTYGEPGRHGQRARNLPLGDSSALIVETEFRTMECAITYDTIICPCFKCSTLSNRLRAFKSSPVLHTTWLQLNSSEEQKLVQKKEGKWVLYWAWLQGI